MAMGIGGGGNTGQQSGSGSGSTLGALMAHMMNRKPAGPVTPAPSAAPSPDQATINLPQVGMGTPAPAAPNFQQRLRSQFGNQENAFADDAAGMSVKPL